MPTPFIFLLEMNVLKKLFLIVGPIVFFATAIWGSGRPDSQILSVAGLGFWMALWWLTAIVPLEVTALIPIVALPLVGGGTVGEVTSAYANPVIFLFMGGFFIAATLERWGLHRRFAAITLRTVGSNARMIVLAFMAISAFASMWITNTATAVMLLPVGVAVAQNAGESKPGFATALMLSIAYGASIGGVATLIGTPPNAILASTAPDLAGVEIEFGRWFGFGLVVSIPILLVAGRVLVAMFGVSGNVETDTSIRTLESDATGFEKGDRFVIGVFSLTAAAWILRSPKQLGMIRIPGLTDVLPGLSDAGIAIAAALIMFVVPIPRSRFRTALDWETARHINWGVLLLFGGGLALAGAFERSGLTALIGGAISFLRGVPFPVVVAGCATLFVLLTELTSNTATAALGMPIVAGAAGGLGLPVLPLMIAAALGASMAFMLPVATPPNAIVFSSGKIKNRDMARAGAVLNLVAIAVITVAVSFVWRM